MITVSDLVEKLLHYIESAPGNGNVEIMLAYADEYAFQFGKGDDHKAFGNNEIERFLVLKPDMSGKRLKL